MWPKFCTNPLFKDNKISTNFLTYDKMLVKEITESCNFILLIQGSMIFRPFPQIVVKTKNCGQQKQLLLVAIVIVANKITSS